ncbi:MAG: FecR domain-containing protein [Patescibacteria group bacterium]
MNSILSFFARHLAFSLMAGIAVLIFALLAFDSAGMPTTDKSEFSPHVLCTQGTTIVKRSDKSVVLSAEKTADIFQGDQIRTRGGSAATVFWTDGSVTRLAENTTVNVSELLNNKDTSSTKVDFSLVEGKSWSRVYRYLSDDSYFHERFDEGRKLAAVRGTAFEIDASKGFLRTQSHAVDVTDPAGKLLATVPEGAIVGIRNLQSLVDAALDSAWEEFNKTEDAKLAKDMAKRAQDEMSARVAALKDLPVAVSFSGGDLSVALAPDYAQKAKEGKVAYQELLKVYQATAALKENPENVKSKEALRDAILAAAPENEKSKLATAFAIHETYDSWTSLSNEEQLLRTRQKLSEYIRAGADQEAVRRIESKLPTDKMDRFNSVMDSLKKKGFDTLSDPNLFMTQPKAVLDSATDAAKSAIEDVRKLVPNIK